ncbi:restriction endonuclease subunit S [Megasphaera massiliensis]|uniref:restriction endonuclease subunit S n=1 Tax=Megasphaera massiliensis TaxID=1232428 RepID=UPI0034B5361C
MNKKKKPLIRFKGFTDDWEQRKLKDIAPLQRGFDLPTTEMCPGNYPVVMSNGIGGYHSTYKVNGPGVVTGRSGTIGKLQYIEDNYWPHNTTLWVTNFYGNNPKYIYYLYQNLDFSRFTSGSGVPTLNRNDVHDFWGNLPSIGEQLKIEKFMTNLDEFITLHQRKCEKLKIIKKSMLENCFPKNGQKVPKIRFSGFTGDWEQRKVLDLLDLLTDFDANGSFADMAKNVNTFDGNGFAWYVRMTDLDNPKPLDELKYVDKPSYDFLRKTHLHGGELLMAKRGNIGKIYIFEPRTEYATVAPNMYLLKLNTKVIPRFLYNFFLSDEGKRQLLRLNASTTMGALYKDDVKNIDVIIPPIEEQKKIAEYFAYLDNLITLHQSKLEKLKKIKKSMLERMFV